MAAFDGLDESTLGVVEQQMLAAGRFLMTVGGGEKTPLHGFTLIGGDGTKLMEKDEDGEGVIGEVTPGEESNAGGGSATIPKSISKTPSLSSSRACFGVREMFVTASQRRPHIRDSTPPPASALAVRTWTKMWQRLSPSMASTSIG